MFPRLPFQSGGSTEDTLATGTASSSVESTISPDDAGGGGGGGADYANDADWWANAIEDDTFFSPMPFDASENGLWNGKFVPPPPRPPFLEDTVSSDGLTTCDLCSWAWHERNSFSSLGDSIEVSGELGWTFTLVVVSVISALLGAIVMIIVLRCRRLKSTNSNGNRPVPWWYRSTRSGGGGGGGAGSGTGGARGSLAAAKHQADSIRGPHNNSGVWTWLTNRRPPSAPDQLGSPTHHQSPAENHYTHMDDAYSPVGVGGEALYAELDRESINSNNPSYQNTAYSQCGEMADQDVPMVSSAPSSAYYSDLSVTAVPTERAYEVVGLTVMSSPLPNWDSGNPSSDSDGPSTTLQLGRRHRLSAINESSTIPSDYV